jgi:hypothetical protein
MRFFAAWLLALGCYGQVPIIHDFDYVRLNATNCQPPLCNVTNRAIFTLSFYLTPTPVHIERSYDGLTWTRTMQFEVSSTNNQRFYWGEYVNAPMILYRLAQ